MYAVCDLALGLVMTKTANFVLKDFPAEPVLPAKLFTQADQVNVLTTEEKLCILWKSNYWQWILDFFAAL